MLDLVSRHLASDFDLPARLEQERSILEDSRFPPGFVDVFSNLCSQAMGRYSPGEVESEEAPLIVEGEVYRARVEISYREEGGQSFLGIGLTVSSDKEDGFLQKPLGYLQAGETSYVSLSFAIDKRKVIITPYVRARPGHRSFATPLFLFMHQGIRTAIENNPQLMEGKKVLAVIEDGSIEKGGSGGKARSGKGIKWEKTRWTSRRAQELGYRRDYPRQIRKKTPNPIWTYRYQ